MDDKMNDGGSDDGMSNDHDHEEAKPAEGGDGGDDASTESGDDAGKESGDTGGDAGGETPETPAGA